MTTQSLAQVARLTATELRLFAREVHVPLFVVAFPVVTVLVLGGVFGTATDNSGFEFVNPGHFYVAAYFGVVLGAIGLIMLPTHVATHRERGVLRRFSSAGFAPWVFPLVQFVCGLCVALVGFGALIVTAVLSSGIPELLSPTRTLSALGLGTLAFISLGVALGMILPSGRAAQGLGLTLFFAMFLLAGGGPPPAAMTDTMRQIGDFLPMTHVIRAAQEPWLGLDTGTDHLVVVAAILAASTIVWIGRSAQVSRSA